MNSCSSQSSGGQDSSYPEANYLNTTLTLACCVPALLGTVGFHAVSHLVPTGCVLSTHQGLVGRFLQQAALTALCSLFLFLLCISGTKVASLPQVTLRTNYFLFQVLSGNLHCKCCTIISSQIHINQHMA